jgi:DNA-binding LytR/AlgR family response regulator
VKILICDDDRLYAEKFKNKLINLSKKYDIDISVDISDSGNNLIFYKDTKYKDVDLIYMDYYMAGLNGRQTAIELRKSGFVGNIIFCSIDEKHALTGYDVGAIGYLVKNKFTDEEFEKVFFRSMRYYKKQVEETLTFTYSGEKRTIVIKDILYFEVRQQMVTVHYYVKSKVKTFEFYSTLSDVYDKVKDKGFVQNHKSYLVAKEYIRDMTYSELTMANGDILPIGRKYRDNCRL